jgi:excinuclease ABC subunit C
MPEDPGVYLFKDRRGKVVYVGKALRLRSRVRSYLQEPGSLDPKTRALVANADAVDYIVTGSELEALVLECTLIKEYRPRYNIRLKDDKRYPYLKLTTGEPFPRLVLVRRILDDGAEYFGPYTDSGAVRRTMRLIQRIFPLRTCTRPVDGTDERECLNFQIGRCCGPCTGRVTEKEYAALVGQVRLFLRGRGEELLRRLEARMKSLSERRCYEEASIVRDQVEAVKRISQRQHAVDPGGGDEDAVAVAREGEQATGVVLRIREGKILGSDTYKIPVSVKDTLSDIYTEFFKQYYHSATDIAPRILLMHPVPEQALLEEWLGSRAGRRVKLSAPSRGHRRRLVELAIRNAEAQTVPQRGRARGSARLLSRVKETLGLPATPRRVEGFDISNIQGTGAVGSMVTFEDGVPLRSGYRHFRIRGVEGSDDFAMMREVLDRRFSRLGTGRDRRPDLILVDGGAGQLSTAIRAMEDAGIAAIPVIGLAKRNEEVHRPGAGVLRLSRRDPVLRFLQRIRDEAHRFAVEYHRKLRGKDLRASELDAIPGIGPRKKMQLLVRFGSVDGIRRAAVEELASVPGIGRATAERIHEHLGR